MKKRLLFFLLTLPCFGEAAEAERAIWYDKPASTWPAGSASGLKARGGYTVDIAWRDGRVTAYSIYGGEANGFAVQP